MSDATKTTENEEDRSLMNTKNERDIHWRLDRLAGCASEKEVWQLMGDYVFPESNNSKFSDEKIILKDSVHEYRDIYIKKDSFGLGIRLLFLMRINGYLGHIPYGSGKKTYLQRFLYVVDYLQNTFGCKSPIDITMEARDSIITYSISEGNQYKTIRDKVMYIEHWHATSFYLPQFLTIDPDAMDQSVIYSEYEKAYADEINQLSIEDKNIFPPHLLKPILKEAITYITAYADEILLLSGQRKEFFLNKNEFNRTIRGNKIVRYFRMTDHIFNEPSLKKLQDHCRSLKYNDWRGNQEHPHYGPLGIVGDAVSRLQATCAIVLLVLTSARSQELMLQYRNIQTPKTKHFHEDQTRHFTRIIWKTNRYGKKHTVPLAPIGIKAYQILSQLSECFDRENGGHLHLSSIILENDTKSNTRLYHLIRNFSIEVNGEDSIPLNPHQLRHAMVSMIGLLNDRDTLNIAAALTGHESLAMTDDSYMTGFRTTVHRNFQYLADSVPDIKEAWEEYEETVSMQVLEEKVEPQLRKGNKFYWNNASNFSPVRITADVESIIAVKKAEIIQGQTSMRFLGIAYCWRSVWSSEKAPCQLGFDEDYNGNLTLYPNACVGSSCSSFMRDEEQMASLIEAVEQFKDSAGPELTERAPEWINIYGATLTSADKKMIEQYKTDMEEKEKHG